jgi:hypothetical protein
LLSLSEIQHDLEQKLAVQSQAIDCIQPTGLARKPQKHWVNFGDMFIRLDKDQVKNLLDQGISFISAR